MDIQTIAAIIAIGGFLCWLWPRLYPYMRGAFRLLRDLLKKLREYGERGPKDGSG